MNLKELSLQIFASPQEIQSEILSLKKRGKTIGFVPTMGNLHAGHISLIEQAKKHTDIVVASIFVNPLQFGPNEDFDAYPRTLQEDTKKLIDAGCDILFTPTNQDIYPQGKQVHTSVNVNRLTESLCGASRPGHFLGVTTIVNILFNIIQPDVAVFGKKDYQQLQVIKAMVSDLMMPIKIIGGEILREKNGLAMSSRNIYLSEQEFEQAAILRQTLLACEQQLKSKVTFEKAENSAIEKLNQNGFKVDYLKIVSQQTLETATPDDKKVLIAAAAWLGKPRLIDNLEVEFI